MRIKGREKVVLDAIRVLYGCLLLTGLKNPSKLTGRLPLLYRSINSAVWRLTISENFNRLSCLKRGEVCARKSSVNREIPEYIYVWLKHEFSCYSVFLPSWVKNYLISRASSFFTYRDTYVCILTLNWVTIPFNWHFDKPWQHLAPYWNHVSVLSASILKSWDSQNSHVILFWVVPLLFWESGVPKYIF